jgi:hypothetical protein
MESPLNYKSRFASMAFKSLLPKIRGWVMPRGRRRSNFYILPSPPWGRGAGSEGVEALTQAQDPLTRPALAGENAGGGLPSPPRGRGRGYGLEGE